jgi:chemotaxis protein histidine kinase CheA
MTTPLGMLDYFAMEASEYIERLRGLVDAEAAPAAPELVRYARALRGAALMANQQPIARAANGLEGLARAMRDGQRGWDATTKDVAQRAVEALAGFVKRASQWSAADGQAAEQLAKDLEVLAGGAVTRLRTPSSSAATPSEAVAASALDAGSRAFLARESALISSALGQAAAALRSAPPARDVLQGVLRRMQPLRGLAALGDLPPLPDLLEAVDRAVAEIGRLPVTPAGAAEVFEAAAKALTRAAQDVTERGLPHADAEESQQFANLTLRTFSTPSGAVSIATLLAEGSEVGSGSPTGPAAEHVVDKVELVSQGEYLVAAADELDKARSITQRDLRLHALAAALRTLGEGAGGRIGDFTSLARDLIGQGVAARGPQDFAAGLRAAGSALQQIPDLGPDQALVDALNKVIQRLLALAAEQAGAAAPVAAAPAPAPKTASSFDSFFNAEARKSTPAAPAPAAPAAAVAAAPAAGMLALAIPGSGATGGIAGAFNGYATLKRSITTPAASVDAFIAGISTAPRPASVAVPAPAPAPKLAPPAPAPVAAAPAPVAPPRPAAPPAAPVPPVIPAAPTADGVVDVKDLCYSGPSALARALAVRKELIEVLANPMRAGGRMRPLLDELLDLIELAQRT